MFSLFFGAALSFIRGKGHNTIYNLIDELAKIMFRVTDYVMRFKPLGVFAAMAPPSRPRAGACCSATAWLIDEFHPGLGAAGGVLFFVGYLFLGKSTRQLGGLIKEPTLLAFSTASSESAYPKTIEALTRFGVPKRISGFVLPLGYSFNLDGSMMYQSFAVLFIAQAYNIQMSFTQQLTLLLVLMVTSKGMAGVARASLVVVAATLPMFHLPEGGLLLIMGIDQFFDNRAAPPPTWWATAWPPPSSRSWKADGTRPRTRRLPPPRRRYGLAGPPSNAHKKTGRKARFFTCVSSPRLDSGQMPGATYKPFARMPARPARASRAVRKP